MQPNPSRIVLSMASEQDRPIIYGIRHQVYAEELGQHPVNPARLLRDRLDDVNCYLVARRGPELLGFVSVTPPGPHGYSIDKYVARDRVALRFDEGLYEVRLLTVVSASRRTEVALLLMYGVLRYLESLGARTVVAIGRLEVAHLYAQVGLERLGPRITSGAVTFDLMAADLRHLRTRAGAIDAALTRLEARVDWQLGVPFRPAAPCHHSGLLRGDR